MIKDFLLFILNSVQNVDAIFMYNAFKCLIIEAQNKQNIKCAVKYCFSHLKLFVENMSAYCAKN